MSNINAQKDHLAGLSYIPNHSITAHYAVNKLPGFCVLSSPELDRFGAGIMFSEFIELNKNNSINMQGMFAITNLKVKEQVGVNIILQVGYRYKSLVYHASIAIPDDYFKNFKLGVGIAVNF